MLGFVSFHERILIINKTHTYFNMNSIYQVIQKNYYYSDADKYQMAESIASFQNKLLAHHARRTAEETAKKSGPDLIFRPDFRKGRAYMEVEQRLKLIEDQKVVEDLTFVQGETNWDVQAVIDEDQL